MGEESNAFEEKTLSTSQLESLSSENCRLREKIEHMSMLLISEPGGGGGGSVASSPMKPMMKTAGGSSRRF